MKGVKEVFSNDMMQFFIFISNLPTETHEKLILCMEIFLILYEILAFFYIRHIIKDY